MQRRMGIRVWLAIAAVGLLLSAQGRVALAQYEAATAEVSGSKVPIDALRYDGKSFEQWKNDLETELKPERRAEAISAFAAFGANGYGRQAAEIILGVVREMKVTAGDYSVLDSRLERPLGPDLIKQAAGRAFVTDKYGYQIAPPDSVPVLIDELAGNHASGRLFSALTLRLLGDEAEEAIPALLEVLEKDESETIRWSAFLALAAIAPHERSTVAALRLALKDPEPAVVRTAVYELVPHSGYAPPSLFQRPDEEWQARYGSSLSSSRHRYLGSASGGRFDLGGWGLLPGNLEKRQLRPDAARVVELLLESVKKGSPAAREEAIKAIGRIGPEAEAAIPQLVRAFNSGDSEDRDLVVHVLLDLRATGDDVESVLWQTLGEHKRLSTRYTAMKALLLQDRLDAEAGVPILVKRFREGKGDERSAAAILLGKIGPKAAPALDVLRTNPSETPSGKVQAAVAYAVDAIESPEETDAESNSGSEPWWLR